MKILNMRIKCISGLFLCAQVHMCLQVQVKVRGAPWMLFLRYHCQGLPLARSWSSMLCSLASESERPACPHLPHFGIISMHHNAQFQKGEGWSRNEMQVLICKYFPPAHLFPVHPSPIWDRVSFWSPGWLASHYIAQAGLRVTETVLLSWVLGCHTQVSLVLLFCSYPYNHVKLLSLKNKHGSLISSNVGILKPGTGASLWL